MYNERLKAEQLKSIDLGLGIQIAGAHSLDLNLYRRDTKDALLEREIPSSNGFSSMLDNVGSLRNEGIELSASSRILNSGDWRLSLRASLAYNRSKVLDLYGKQVIYTNSDNIIPDYEVGKPYDYVYGLDALGVNPLRGELMFRDQKGQEQPFSKEIKREGPHPPWLPNPTLYRVTIIIARLWSTGARCTALLCLRRDQELLHDLRPWSREDQSECHPWAA